MKMGGLRKHMPITRITFLISCLAIAGISRSPASSRRTRSSPARGACTRRAGRLVYGKMLWAGCSLAALGTAFYMWRLYFLVFAGKTRGEAAKHAHESPPSMTVPLVVLAFLATIAGFIGLPHVSSATLVNKRTTCVPGCRTRWRDVRPRRARVQVVPHLSAARNGS